MDGFDAERIGTPTELVSRSGVASSYHLHEVPVLKTWSRNFYSKRHIVVCSFHGKILQRRPHEARYERNINPGIAIDHRNGLRPIAHLQERAIDET